MKQKLKMFLTAMLALLILVSVMPMQYVHAEDGAVEAESIGADVSAASVQTKLDRLRELLVGKYFTVDQKACTHGSSGTCKNCKNSNVIATSWFKNLFGTVSVNNFPEHYNVNGGQFYATAYECAGFAAFAGWYIFADSNSEKIKVIDANPSNRSFNYSTMQAYAKPGDILRLSKNSSGNTGHSAILVSFDSNGITVIDCNYVGRSLVGYHSIKYSSKYNYVAISRCDKEPLDPPPVTPTHTVTFKDGYTGGTISTATVNHGGTAALPTPPDHSGDGYHFVRWDGDNTNVTSDRTVTAMYEINKYTVTFKDGFTGGTISTATVNHGGTAALPTPPDHSGDGYHFARWDGDNTNVTSNRTVTAMYEINKYTVTFKDGFTGGTISTATVSHGGTAALPTPPDHSGDGYHFARWDGNNTNVTSDRTVTAMYEINQYVVTFVDGFNNEVISQVTVNHGDDVEFPDAPNHEDDGYRFTYWDGDNTNVTEARTIMAMYNTYKITFVDGHTGEIVDIQWVNNGEDAIAPTLPYAEIDGYRYEWDKDFTNVKYPMTVTANFTYRVSFVDEHTGETVSEQWVMRHGAAVAPDMPYTEAAGYIYAWDKDFTNITDTMVVTARFTYRVRFVNEHTGEIASEQWIRRGNDAVAPVLPYAEADGYRYEWDKDYTNVTDTMVVTARFTYRVQFVNEHTNETVSVQWIAHGSDATAPELPYTEADGYRYAWDRDFTNINDTMVVTARFTYRVRFIDQHTDEIVSEQWIVRGSDATAPELPYTEADGYRYAWDEECTNVTDTMVITARFTYRVRFIDGFDNTMLDERWIEHGEATEIPQAPHHYGYHLTVWCCQNDAGTIQHNCEHVDGVLEPLNVTALYERHMYNVTLKWSSCGTVDPGMDIGESGVLEGLGYGDTITLKMNPDYGHYVWYITINGEIVIVRPGNTYAIELLSDVDGDTYDIFVMFRTDSAEASTPTTPTSPTKPPKTGAAAMTAVAIMAIISGAGIMLARKK